MEHKKTIFESRTIMIKILMVVIALGYKPAYDKIMQIPELYFVIDILVTIFMRMITKDEVKL